MPDNSECAQVSTWAHTQDRLFLNICGNSSIISVGIAVISMLTTLT